MTNDEEAAVAAHHGEARPATVDEDKFTLSIDDAIMRYNAEGIPRTRRTIQRYCSNKTLDAHRFAIPYGEKYLITLESLERHIAYVLQGEAAMAGRGEPRLGVIPDMPTTSESFAPRKKVDQRLGMSDHAGPWPAHASKGDARIANEGADIMDMLRDENTFLKEQIVVKDAQLAVKDRQIADQSERVRETNLLVASLHKLITPLIGQGGRPDPFSAPAAAGPNTDDIHPPRL